MSRPQPPSLPELVGEERRWFPVALVLPALILLLSVSVFPFLFSLRSSLLDWNLLGTYAPRFVGLGNYLKALGDPLFWHGLKVTAYFVLAVVFLQIPAGLGMALLVNSLPRGSQVIATVLAMPMVLAPSVIGFQWVQILNQQFGPLDHILRRLGLPDPAWTADPRTALPALLLVDFWAFTPFVFLLLLAGLQAIPPAVLEAAQVDGSSQWQVFRHITLPMLRRFMVLALIFRALHTIKNPELIYIMTQGGPGTTTQTIAYYSYKQGFVHFNLGYASALAIIQLIIITILVKRLLAYAERRA